MGNLFLLGTVINGMMMSQNIPMKQYLNSKAVLMSVSVLILVLSTLSLFWVENPSHKSCATYNLVSIFPLIFAGSYKKIDLEKSPFMNYQGTGATQWIVGLLMFLLTILIN
jgi:hypothetical protein